MRHTAMIIIALLCCVAIRAQDGDRTEPRLSIRAEYRQDALDYDDDDKRFFRERARITFGKSSLCFTHVYIGAQRENRFTWNLNLRGISPHFDCLLGNYYPNFGTGLIAGKKTATSPDIFSRRVVISRGNPFIPCSSGNPLFSFHGIASGFTFGRDDFSISVRGFFSYRNRYVRTDMYQPRHTGSSITSILNRTKKDYRYSEPAEIQDYGYVISLSMGGHFLLQNYFIYTRVGLGGTRTLLWNYGDRGLPAGDKAFFAYGFYFEYADDYITIFAELGFPRRVLSWAGGMKTTERGWGAVYGLSFRHRACSISLTGKKCGKKFYTPCGSGNGGAEDAWMADLSVRPVTMLTLGGGFYSEKKVAPTGYDSYLPSSRRERAFARFGKERVALAVVRFSCVESDTKNGTDRSLQFKPSIKIYILESVLISLSGTAQSRGGGRYSASAGAGLTACFRYFTVKLNYTRFFISRTNPLYASVMSRRDAVTRGLFVNSSSSMASCLVSARYRASTLSVRWQHQFAGAATLRCGIEVSASCTL